MKKVKFDNSRSIALHETLPGVTLKPEQLQPVKIEGWLVDDHVCVQKPIPEINAGWRVSLYPWGDLISGDFYTKADATEYAEDVSKLGIDWNAVYSPENYAKSELHVQAVAKLSALRDRYAADGYLKPFDEPSEGQ